jgi:hypothetical protein
VKNVSDRTKDFYLAAGLSLFAALVFNFTTKATLSDFDYTNRIASALLHGHLGLDRHPGSWLNEMVPWESKYYSVFPLGAVLSVVPVALLQEAGWIHSFPAHFLTALIAGLCVFFFFRLSSLESKSLGRGLLLALFPIFGTWTWCNLGFGGAWQIALGFALLGQTAALHFTLVRPSPFLAGGFFALAFGNRTELLITLPFYLYFLWRQPSGRQGAAVSSPPQAGNAIGTRDLKRGFRGKIRMLVRFLSLPAMLALLTAGYNFARFDSIFDFGYTHIPETFHWTGEKWEPQPVPDSGQAQFPTVSEEPWYQHGLFSVHAIPRNMYTMLFQGFDNISYFPYLRPNGYGCSIFLASPFLCLLFRQGGRYKLAAWVAIGFLTVVLWLHGNPGGWQFSYRYGMVLLPWMFLLLAGNGPTNITVSELSLFVVSVTINAIATWQFLWTHQIPP